MSLKAFVKRPIKWLFHYKAKSSIKTLLSHESLELKAIGEAVIESLNDFIDDEDRSLINSIESRRSVLLNSHEEIPVIDFGAGKGDSQLTTEQMMAGIEYHQSVAKISEGRSKPAFWAKIMFKIVRKLQP